MSNTDFFYLFTLIIDNRIGTNTGVDVLSLHDSEGVTWDINITISLFESLTSAMCLFEMGWEKHIQWTQYIKMNPENIYHVGVQVK